MEHLKEFTKEFYKIQSKNSVQVFDDFLTVFLTQFCLEKTELGEKLHKEAISPYSEKEKKIINNLFHKLIFVYKKGLEVKKWYDPLGLFYENELIGKFHKKHMAQFFTPASICDMMSVLQGKAEKGSKINDPACGSGRFILSHHVQNIGCYYVAEDLDLLCVKMSVVNFLIHGVIGQVLWHNTLTEPGFARYMFSINTYLRSDMLDIPHLTIQENITYEKPTQNNLTTSNNQLNLFE